MAASLLELVEQACSAQNDKGVWLFLRRFVPSWIHHGQQVTWSCSSETPAGLDTECPPPSAAPKRAVARRLDVIDPPVPVQVKSSAFFRSRLERSRKGYRAPESETWDQLVPMLPSNERPTDVLAGPLGNQMTSPKRALPENYWPPGPAKANVWV